MKTAGPKYQEKEKKARQQPTELFRIWLEGSPTALYYTSGDQNITYDNRTYEAKAISRGPVEFDTTSKVTRCDITVGYLLESVQAYLLISPPDDYWIEVRRFFRDTPGASVIQFLGKMKSISFKGAQANIECTGFEDHLNFAVPHYRYQKACNNTLYDAKCGIAKGTYAAEAVLLSVAENGLLLRATAFALKNNDFYTYGEVVWNDYGRMITYHAGEYVRIKFPMPQLTATEVVTIHAGCDLDIATCINKFRNQDNFFGQTEIPVENPATRIP